MIVQLRIGSVMMSIIPVEYINAVVALGTEDSVKRKHWVGTGFVVGRKEKQDKTRITCYLVTNNHVVRGNKSLLVRFNSQITTQVKDYEISLVDNQKPIYTSHPNPKIDIVALQINPNVLINDKSEWASFDLDDNTLTLEQMKESGVDEGALVYALGFPMNLVSDSMKAPICRLGCISRISDAFKLSCTERSFLVDAQAFPGNSGGPIISRPEVLSIQGTKSNSKANLIGILSAYIPYQEKLISAQTGETRMIQTENSGLTLVYPVDYIKETVEAEWHRIQSIQRIT